MVGVIVGPRVPPRPRRLPSGHARLRPPRPHRPGRPRRPRASGRRPARIVVLGDLMLDVVLAPERALETRHRRPRPGDAGPGRLGGEHRPLARPARRADDARSRGRARRGRPGAGRCGPSRRGDAAGRPRRGRADRPDRRPRRAGRRALVRRRPRRRRPAAPRTTSAPAGSAAPTPSTCPAYSLLGEPLGQAGRRAVALARAARRASSASTSPRSRRCSRRAGARPGRSSPRSPRTCCSRPPSEAEALLGRYAVEGLLEFAPIVVVKRGAEGATVLAQLEGGARSASRSRRQQVPATDTTGAGDAFDAGFLVGWLAARAAGRSPAASLQRAALAGHRAAARQLTTPRPELALS